jgi:hypothetical protein
LLFVSRQDRKGNNFTLIHLLIHIKKYFTLRLKAESINGLYNLNYYTLKDAQERRWQWQKE